MFAYFDIISLLTILILTLPILALAGSLRDLVHALSIAFSRSRQSTALEMKRAVAAVSLCRTVLLYSGLFWFLAAGIAILTTLDSLVYLGPNLAVAILSPLYAVTLCLLLLPVQAAVEKKLMALES